MSKRGFFSASNDIKTLDGNIFSGFPWLTTQLTYKKETKERGKIVHVYVLTASWKPSIGLEGLHDTYTRTILPRRLVSLLYGAV